MIKAAIDYAKSLIKMKSPKESLQETRTILDTVPELRIELEDPTVAIERKHTIVDHIFPKDVRDFLKILTDNQDFKLFNNVYDAFIDLSRPQAEREITAELVYVTPPTDEQLESIRKYLMKEFDKPDIIIEQKQDKSLKSGFIIKFGSREYDWSEEGRAGQLKERLAKVVKSDEKEDFSKEHILALLKGEVDDFTLEAEKKEVGVVKTIGDGIAIIDGLDHAFYGEIVLFDGGVRGMVQDIRRDEIGVILLGRETGIEEGTRVVRTGKQAGVPVGEGFLGRVVNALGDPIDGKGEIKAEGFRPIECPAPSIVDRKSVAVPMETGILSIDSMFPIGRGQRELIIGDRQTGKTSIATDTIINQKGKDVICVYVAIGQKASTIAKLVTRLKNAGAMDYTIILQATASDPASMQYIAPYAGTSLAEYFMYQGKDVLIVYDDLSKHAVAYRAISLLLERSPGREAYPGDVFYLHSRLLERSSRLTPEAGGGSITALPIIETQEGDVSAYIPTNVISITDGQIYLESELFFEGQRPAVNVGLSVSRVGGAAQTKAMKKAAGSLRVDLAQYKELQVFTQFSSDLDDATKKTLVYGKSLMELLKQPLGSPMSMADQVITLVTATDRQFMDIEVPMIKKFQGAMLDDMKKNHADIINKLNDTKVLDDDTRQAIIKACIDFKKGWMEENDPKTRARAEIAKKAEEDKKEEKA
ncbi:MAG: F0F1 ATP synthase subunit alpha [Lachnospiraceae bacterium]|nr:F0F1 ATP synthase subunit alpha [Lachnospiraceae bacterium]